MKSLIKIALLFSLLLIFGGCARMCAGINRDFQVANRYYNIQQYSGGKLIKEWNFYGMLNNQSNSDGYYFTVNDTLYEIGGDIIISSVSESKVRIL